ncbi:MAG: deoxyribose-phosphate aldolase [Candidatus Hydrogenedentota bacterium]|nr:MAG: deoxyribose-phosphate aldolase [Candidatus Hydrogenedentota bacterium]
MDKQTLIDTITKQVMARLNQPGSHSQGVKTSSCNCECHGNWDGVGNIADMLEAGAGRVSTIAPLGSCPDPALARFIDHTLLKPEATQADIEKLCQEAAENCFMSVCVNPYWVRTASKLLRGTGVKVCTVVGFPLGATPSRVKELETRIAIDDGAREIDMVINIGALKSGLYKEVENDIRAVVRATRGTVLSKVILETCLLTKEEIVTACKLSEKAGANFVKTSTGFSKGGAKIEDIRLMRQTVGDAMGVKASGGIRDHETALNMLMAGASRIGASASVAIVSCAQPAGGGKY